MKQKVVAHKQDIGVFLAWLSFDVMLQVLMYRDNVMCSIGHKIQDMT